MISSRCFGGGVGTVQQRSPRVQPGERSARMHGDRRSGVAGPRDRSGIPGCERNARKRSSTPTTTASAPGASRQSDRSTPTPFASPDAGSVPSTRSGGFSTRGSSRRARTRAGASTFGVVKSARMTSGGTASAHRRAAAAFPVTRTANPRLDRQTPPPRGIGPRDCQHFQPEIARRSCPAACGGLPLPRKPSVPVHYVETPVSAQQGARANRVGRSNHPVSGEPYRWGLPGSPPPFVFPRQGFATFAGPPPAFPLTRAGFRGETIGIAGV